VGTQFVLQLLADALKLLQVDGGAAAAGRCCLRQAVQTVSHWHRQLVVRLLLLFLLLVASRLSGAVHLLRAGDCLSWRSCWQMH
jgi:hypothetical protein